MPPLEILFDADSSASFISSDSRHEDSAVHSVHLGFTEFRRGVDDEGPDINEVSGDKTEILESSNNPVL